MNQMSYHFAAGLQPSVNYFRLTPSQKAKLQLIVFYEIGLLLNIYQWSILTLFCHRWAQIILIFSIYLKIEFRYTFQLIN